MMAAMCPRNGSRWLPWKSAIYFGSVSYETQVIEGRWQQAGVVYRDNLARIVVDMPDKKENRAWMKAFKRRWKEKLDQLEIWMISYRIDIE